MDTKHYTIRISEDEYVIKLESHRTYNKPWVQSYVPQNYLRDVQFKILNINV